MADHQPQSLLQQGRIEADQHKWIESERHGRDLGDAAIREWVQQHWPKFVRACWNEHMEGKRFWKELDRNDFGILRRLYEEHRELATEIHTRLRSGEENLDVILWAFASNKDIDTIRPLLERLDINRCRAVPDPLDR